jgi:hypothetical protein
VSGAQEPETFLKTMEQVLSEKWSLVTVACSDFTFGFGDHLMEFFLFLLF